MGKFRNSRIGKFCSDPIVAFAVAVISIILGLLTSLYFYELAFKERNLTYYVNPNITTIVKPNALSDLTVNYHGFPITNGLYSVQISIWNEGKEPIEDRDILQPIFVVAPKDVQVIQLSILKRSRDVTNFHIVDGSLANKIEMTWRILERGDGVTLQLFYTGEPQSEFRVDGIIKEQRNLSKFTTATAGFSSRFIFKLIVFLFCFCALPAYWIWFFFLTRNYAGFYLSLKRVRYQMAVITLVLIATIIFSAYQLYETPLRNSPFGF